MKINNHDETQLKFLPPLPPCSYFITVGVQKSQMKGPPHFAGKPPQISANLAMWWISHPLTLNRMAPMLSLTPGLQPGGGVRNGPFLLTDSPIQFTDSTLYSSLHELMLFEISAG
jgi:hypothetical protein